MSEGGEGARKAGGIFGNIANAFIPHPTLAPVKFWQGIVEMVGRGVLLALTLIMFGASSAAEDNAGAIDNNANYRNAQAAAGWTIFVGVLLIIYEIIFIVCRFVNFNFMTAYRPIILLTDVIVNGVTGLAIFAGAVSLAYYAEFTRDFISSAGEFRNATINLTNALGTGAFFSFAVLFNLIFLAVWMLLYFVLKWDIKSGTSTDSSDAE